MGSKKQTSGSEKKKAGDGALMTPMAWIAVLVLVSAVGYAAFGPDAADTNSLQANSSSKGRDSRATAGTAPDDIRNTPRVNYEPSELLTLDAEAEAEIFAPIRLDLPPIDDAGMVTIDLAPNEESGRWQNTDDAIIDFTMDDEEWDSYELPAKHPEARQTCTSCHAPASRKSF